MEFVLLGSDALLFFLVIALLGFAVVCVRHEHLRRPWSSVFYKPLGLFSVIILLIFFLVAVLDSIHFREALPAVGDGGTVYSTQVKSLLDKVIQPIGAHTEKTYSAPLATRLYTKQSARSSTGEMIRDYLPLTHVAKHVASYDLWQMDISQRIGLALILTLLFTAILVGLSVFWVSMRRKVPGYLILKSMLRGQGRFPWRTFFFTLVSLSFVVFLIASLAQGYYVMGTDKVGQDVLYEAIKSIRTGILIGTLTTLVMLPFAVVLGMMAGYFGGLIDDIVQYLYTTLSSIPGVLLIAAAILSIQVFISNHPEYFATINARADARLLALCFILGITSWTSLCRVLRAETLKLRELDYVDAAKLLGSNWWRILTSHVLPNIGHIILITIVLDFSSLVLAEAVLTYVGVGVDPTTLSWGNMIDGARLELAREPIVWWPLVSAFGFMFIFILAANLFADAVRDAFDPRAL